MSKRDHGTEGKQAFENGATRSIKLERYDLLPPEGERAAALRFGLGAQKHGENNWKGGGAEFIKGTINHLKAHVTSLLEHNPEQHEDDDIGAILFGGYALAWFRERKPEEFKKALRELRDGKAE